MTLCRTTAHAIVAERETVIAWHLCKSVLTRQHCYRCDLTIGDSLAVTRLNLDFPYWSSFGNLGRHQWWE